jgi:hypothetical protein
VSPLERGSSSAADSASGGSARLRLCPGPCCPSSSGSGSGCFCIGDASSRMSSGRKPSGSAAPFRLLASSSTIVPPHAWRTYPLVSWLCLWFSRSWRASLLTERRPLLGWKGLVFPGSILFNNHFGAVAAARLFGRQGIALSVVCNAAIGATVDVPCLPGVRPIQADATERPRHPAARRDEAADRGLPLWRLGPSD